MPKGRFTHHHPERAAEYETARKKEAKPARKQPEKTANGKLKRDVGLLGSVAYGVGIILGAGIYALIGPAAGLAGNALWVSFLIAATIASFTGLSYAELSSMYPKCAAEYVYIKQSFRNSMFAFIVGWLSIAVGIISVSAVALGFGGYFHSLFASVPLIAAAAGLIIIMSALNFYGIGLSAKLNIIFTIIEAIGLLIVIFLGLPHIGSVNLMDFSSGFTGIFGAAALIFFAYLGFEEIVNISEETKDARRTVPKSLIISIIVTTLVYMMISVTVVSVVPSQELAQSKSPLALVAERSTNIGGPQIALLIAIMALFATGNTVLILLIVASRMIYGMSEGGSLPNFWKRIHEKRGTPHIAVFTTMLLSLLFVLSADVSKVANITDFGAFLIFAAVNLAVIYLRFREPKTPRFYKMPVNIGRVPVLAFLGFLFSLYMLTHFDASVWMIGGAVIFSGLAFYDYWQKTK